MQQKILLVFGTRPEAIKMAPLVKQFSFFPEHFNLKVCVTAQHREMLDQVLDFFEITPHYDLDLMKKGQNLFQLTADIILGMKSVLEEFKPDYVFVHGDTTTSMATALSAFYAGAKVCHVEAGLRTFDKLSPFPEEINRQLTGRISDIHFAPTVLAKENLAKEGTTSRIYVTGNTVIDALFWATQKLVNYEDEEIRYLKSIVDSSKKLILITGHRRENFGDGFLKICRAIKRFAQRTEVQIIYPVHLNPNVQQPVFELLDDLNNVRLIKPLSYPAFVWLMNKSYFILTDSGGVQEEAPSLGKPVLVMRDTTERPEAVDAGTVILVGTNEELILSSCERLLDDHELYQKMAQSHNPYGDGTACERIVNALIN
ncbi:UDP-N-acetylglucosamine 2-epimerase (non-hydrolyzing) [Pedobacter chinensis]|uniref:UDP-N-acetylglucosamine 2-epimerase (non-hydrolyzing) n=1 Tax=Pedobacter chinensis TaxID=2282421 RepID=A0A369PNS0_9SPHI|nr:UDP-N-acetylglucosamine 2-epimerase (non-hydrolyzing) [Pedobacter chinensis]RDC54243.1 UDP-N-acetylglucosamine 2-epimerase (non-hydrolyzing) [Pedobacter chinensis]